VANHDGGRMLNHVIGLLRRDRVFERLGRSRSQQLILEIVKHADHQHDCRAYEILEGHGAALGLCSNWPVAETRRRQGPLSEVPGRALVNGSEISEMRWGTASVKEQMIRLVQEQPDDGSFEEILRELAFPRMVDRGLSDSAAGRIGHGQSGGQGRGGAAGDRFSSPRPQEALTEETVFG
jgi:hypothetical protein